MNKQITIFGVGCSLCQLLRSNIRRASQDLGLEIEIHEVTDIQEMINRGISAIPALAVGNEVVASGRVPEVSDIIRLLQS